MPPLKPPVLLLFFTAKSSLTPPPRLPQAEEGSGRCGVMDWGSGGSKHGAAHVEPRIPNGTQVHALSSETPKDPVAITSSTESSPSPVAP